MKARSDKSSDVRSNKGNFFKSPYSQSTAEIDKAMEQAAQNQDIGFATTNYKFLINNQELIIADFETIFAVLETQKQTDNNKKYWLYSYYLASLLEEFHRAYVDEINRKKFAELKLKIKGFLDESKVAACDNSSFMDYVKKKILDGFKELLRSPLHTTTQKQYLGYLNLWRIYWIFASLTLSTAFKYASIQSLMNQIDGSINLNDAVDTFHDNGAKDFCNIISFALFSARFLINSTLLVLHTFFPTPEERKNNTCWPERLKYERKKRRFGIANDVAWTPINIGCNYKLFGIDELLGAQITAAFLFFDLAVCSWRYLAGRNEYLNARAQNLQEIKDFKNKRASLLAALSQFEPGEKEYKEINETLMNRYHVDDLAMLEDQLKMRDMQWQAKQQAFAYLIAAALFLAAGFTASLSASPVGCYFICTFAVALFRTDAKFNAYRESSVKLSMLNMTSGHEFEQRIAIKRFNLARRDFYLTLARNTFMPLILITAFSTFPVVGIALALACIAAQALLYYVNHEDNKSIGRLEHNFAESNLPQPMPG